jgi:glycosyltransferase involved in cell wall biosynthesis
MVNKPLKSARPDIRLSKLAVVLQSSSTGGWRYTCRLVEAFKQLRPDVSLTVFLGKKMKSVGESDSPRRVLEGLGAQVETAPTSRSIDKRSRLRYWASLTRRSLSRLSHRRWCRRLDEHDAVLFAWPYRIEFPSISAPVAFVPHDFNYTHFFGEFVEKNHIDRLFRDQHRVWLKHAQPIVSSQFIAEDLRRAFPAYQGEIPVVPLSHLGHNVSIDDAGIEAIVRGLGVGSEPYVLCINNIAPHKNLGQVMAGFHYMSRRFTDAKLVIVGFGTDGIRGELNSPYYLDNRTTGGNVVSLGLRSDREVTALIRRASVVVNGSLYEAGNGSGLDAWMVGTPVAMSNIPPFIEQMKQLGVHAETFNPRCCYEIGDALCRVMENPTEAKRLAVESAAAIRRYSWHHVATKYFEILDDLVGAKELFDCMQKRAA